MTTQCEIGVTYSVGIRVPSIINGLENGGPFRVSIYRYENDRLNVVYRAQSRNPSVLLDRFSRDFGEVARMVSYPFAVDVKEKILSSIRIHCGLVANSYGVWDSR